MAYLLCNRTILKMQQAPGTTRRRKTVGIKKKTEGKQAKGSSDLLLRIRSGLLVEIDRTVGALKKAEGEDQVSRAEFIRESAEVFTKIPPAELVKLRRLARESGVVLSGIIREAIQPYITADEPTEGKAPPLILSILRQRAAERRAAKAE
jgi:hypothetical protein